MRQVHRPMTLGQILLMQRFDPDEMVLEERDERGGKGRETVLIPLAGADGELLHGTVNVLDAEPDGFHNAQATAVQHFCDQLRGATHERQDRGDFGARHDDGDVDFLVGAHGIDAVLQRLVEDALVQKDQGIHGLVLGRRRHVALEGQVGEERLDLGFGGEEVVPRPHPVEPDEADDPLDVGALRVDGVMLEPEDAPDVLQEFRWRSVEGGVGVSHKKSLYGGLKSVDNTTRAKVPENLTITNDIIAKIPVRVDWAKVPENACYTGLSEQDDVLINGSASEVHPYGFLDIVYNCHIH